MAELIRNVHVPDHGWYGPAHGNAADVPAEVAALITNPRVWDDPIIAAPQEQSPTGDGGGEAAAEPAAGAPGSPQPEAGGDASGTSPVDPVAAALALLEALAAVPADKGALLAFAAEHGFTVAPHLSAVNMRAAIEAAVNDGLDVGAP